MVLTSEIIRAARALLRWEQKQLAEASGVSLPTVKRLETAPGPLGALPKTAQDLQRALEAAGIIFVAENGDGPGVRLKKQKALDRHIEHLESKVADLKGAASGEPSPAKGMAMLRRGRAKSDLANAKNKRAKESK